MIDPIAAQATSNVRSSGKGFTFGEFEFKAHLITMNTQSLIIVFFLIWLCPTSPVFAQQTPPTSAPPNSPSQEKEIEKQEQSQRMLE